MEKAEGKLRFYACIEISNKLFCQQKNFLYIPFLSSILRTMETYRAFFIIMVF